MGNAAYKKDDELKDLLHRLHEVTKLQRKSQDQCDYLIHRMMGLFPDDKEATKKPEEGREGDTPYPVHVLVHRSYDTVGKRLTFLRALSGRTREEMERIYGVPEISLRQLEHDKYRLTKKMADRLYKAYTKEGIAVSLDWIWFGFNSSILIA